MGILYVVDRFEGDFAVLENEDGSHKNTYRELLPENVREGDILEFTEDDFIIREDLIRERRDKILKKQKKLFRHRSEEI